MIKINKAKNFKKGDKIEIKGEEYLVEDFDVHMEKNGNDFMEGREIILTKVGEKPKVLLKQKYALKYNKKDKEVRFYKLVQEKETFPGGFKFKSRGAWISYQKIK